MEGNCVEGIQHRVRRMQDRAHLVSTEFAELCRRESLPCPAPTLPGLVRRERPRDWADGEVVQCEERLVYLCDCIQHSLTSNNNNTTSPAKLAQVLGSTFSSVVELMLGVEVQEGIKMLVPGPNLIAALAGVTTLALEGNNLCRLLVGGGAVP